MSILVAVAPDKFALGLGPGCDNPPVCYEIRELREALTADYGTDAHLVTYVFDGKKRQPRINKPSLADITQDVLPRVSVFFCDVDNPGHADWTDEAREAARQQESACALLDTAGIYDTPHGRRFVQPLEASIPVNEVERYLARWLDELEAAGIAVDKNCKDWTRHYRVPNFCKDGEAYSAVYMNLDRMRPIALAPLPPQEVAKPLPPAAFPSSCSSSLDKVRRANLYANATPPAIQGASGDHSTFTLCTTLVRGFDLSDGEALEALRDWNARCSPPWAEEELLKKIQGGRKYGTEPIGGKLATQSPRQALLTPPKTAEQRRADAAALSPKPVTNPKPSFVFQAGKDLWDEPISNPLWLVSGLLPEAGVCVIAGEPKATKTWSALELGMALATATPAFGEYEVTKARGVAVFLAEDGKRSVKARIRALADSRHMDPRESVSNMHIICRGHINLLDPNEMVALVDACRAIPNLGLLVMDPLRDLHNAEENDSTAMKQVTEALRHLRDSLGCSILFVHHAAKAGKDTESRRPGQRMRGSSVVHGAVDAGIYLSDTDTDLQTYWTNKVHVEIKEGAGAGVFSLTLNLNNDDDGRATGGSWNVEPIEGKQSNRNSALRESVVATLQAQSAPIGIRKLKGMAKCGESTLRKVLTQLQNDGLVQDVVENGVSKGVVLTSKRTPIPPIPNPSPRDTWDPTHPTHPRSLLVGTGVVGIGVASQESGSHQKKPGMGQLTPEERQRLLDTDTTRDEYRESLIEQARASNTVPYTDPEAEAVRRQILAESGHDDSEEEQ